jgi:hypothetical protein
LLLTPGGALAYATGHSPSTTGAGACIPMYTGAETVQPLSEPGAATGSRHRGAGAVRDGCQSAESGRAVGSTSQRQPRRCTAVLGDRESGQLAV